jgi:outer membrane protein TolC
MSITLPIQPRREAQLQRLAEKWDKARAEYERAIKREELELRRARLQLRNALAKAQAEGASLSELGAVLEVSKQRVFQILREED